MFTREQYRAASILEAVAHERFFRSYPTEPFNEPAFLERFRVSRANIAVAYAATRTTARGGLLIYLEKFIVSPQTAEELDEEGGLT